MPFSLRSLGSSLLLSLLSLTGASPNDPHVFHSAPWFEGWYFRLHDAAADRVVGAAFGFSAPDTSTAPKGATIHKAYIMLLLQEGQSGKLQKLDIFPDPETVTINGRPVESSIASDPSLYRESNFTWCATKNGCFSVDEGRVERFNLTDGGEYFLEGKIGTPVHWGTTAADYGPMGVFAETSLIPLKWFVHTTTSQAESYRFKWGKRGPMGTAGDAAKTSVHQEKNWGDSFPTSWIWSQFSDRTTGSYAALTFGHVTVGPFTDRPAFLLGYRNYQKTGPGGAALAADFRPDNSVIVNAHLDGCAGNFFVELEGVEFRIQVTVTGEPSTFSDKLWGPVSYGFAPVCTETFNAHVEVKLFRRDCTSVLCRSLKRAAILAHQAKVAITGVERGSGAPMDPDFKLVDSASAGFSALEFGGGFQCGEPKGQWDLSKVKVKVVEEEEAERAYEESLIIA
uniref:AttH domain-containing protein n=1 Tax=Chromera velia CCMP2878 TaxID=1169474 RepID=A0A0G4GPL4_9ALVE|mmetsp:Transcript_39658/g.78104  ORF Transcript_39658/g.78104 Transcript_39658/m.78104 type:complete len:453 (+) Transcript_39658:178-1536(+)|eukprot:Cvel_22795.t1-p1 / transcript=Cvel_22795.t1 / gene=Cvel_22795 / organism=Chromera_velia_CCMP2878 / gene_product=hypothetical protein / transcript_product=hypothetical protein / location=Cvel_scaffold2280:23136-26363(+) / protein_length=452 / sequence_SO=supercontig / SO=protein_coding / is_pseudo=false